MLRVLLVAWSWALLTSWAAAAPEEPWFSELWGVDGEKWRPDGRLLDYSYAGFAAAEQPIPDVPAVGNVRDFGAKGDGLHDDSAAVEQAIAAVGAKVSGQKPGALLFPPGTYRLDKQLTIRASGIVLRGAGPQATKLYLPNSLTDLYGQSWKGAMHTSAANATNRHSDWKNGPGLIRFAARGPDQLGQSTLLAHITGSADRGSYEVPVAAGAQSSLREGTWVTVALSDAAGSLLNDLGGSREIQPPCSVYCVDYKNVLRYHTRIAKLGPGRVTFERPLPFNISAGWSPAIHAFKPDLTMVGMEAMTVEHRWKPYAGHLMEDGYNGVEFYGASNCWARDLHVINSDNALTAWASSFCTFDNIVFNVTKPRGMYDGHHGFNVSLSQDVLVSNFQIPMRSAHDISVFAWNVGVVFANGTGSNINLDHHRLFPYGTLWSNINLGAGTRPFRASGEPQWGPFSSAFGTFWNLHSASGSPLPWSRRQADWGPLLNFVGCRFGPKWPQELAVRLGWHKEVGPRGRRLHPADLYTAMVQTRRKRLKRA